MWDLVGGLSVLSKANEEGDLEEQQSAISQLWRWRAHCKHTLCLLCVLLLLRVHACMLVCLREMLIFYTDALATLS